MPFLDIDWDVACAAFQASPRTLYHFCLDNGWSLRLQSAMFVQLKRRGLASLVPKPGHAGRTYREPRPVAEKKPRGRPRTPLRPGQRQVVASALLEAGSLRALAKLLGKSPTMVAQYRDLELGPPDENWLQLLNLHLAHTRRERSDQGCA
jgi:hypothetical protein